MSNINIVRRWSWSLLVAAVLAFFLELLARISWPVGMDMLLNNAHPWQYLVAAALTCMAYVWGYNTGSRS